MSNLREWAERLYASGTNEEAEYGRQILELFDLEERDELLGRIEDDLAYQARHHCPQEVDPLRIIEKLGDRAELADECERRLKEHGFEGQDIDDQVEQLAAVVSDIKQTLECMGGYEIGPRTDLDLLVQDLCQRPKFDL